MTNLFIATRVITFFGTELRALWEHIVCRICKIPIEDSRSFKVSELCGHIEHELIKTKGAAFLMCFLPGFFNLILSMVFLLGGAYRIFYIGDYSTWTSYIFLWLGISFAANCLPSFEDMLSFKDAFYAQKGISLAKIVLAPMYLIIYAGTVLERYSLTFVLSIAFAWIFPFAFSYVFPVITYIQNALS